MALWAYNPLECQGLVLGSITMYQISSPAKLKASSAIWIIIQWLFNVLLQAPLALLLHSFLTWPIDTSISQKLFFWGTCLHNPTEEPQSSLIIQDSEALKWPVLQSRNQQKHLLLCPEMWNNCKADVKKVGIFTYPIAHLKMVITLWVCRENWKQYHHDVELCSILDSKQSYSRVVKAEIPDWGTSSLFIFSSGMDSHINRRELTQQW